MKILKFLLLTLTIVILAACGDDSSDTSITTSASGDEKVYTLKVAHSSAATDDRLESSLQEFKNR